MTADEDSRYDVTNDYIMTVENGHQFYIDHGEINIWVLDADWHNGPGCMACGDLWCHHCNPEIYGEECNP